MKSKMIFSLLAVIFCVTLFASCSSDNKKKAALFYDTYTGDEYTQNLRSKLDNRLSGDKNIVFENYSAKHNQKTQTEQIEAEVQKGADILMVNMSDNSSKEEAGRIVDIAKNADVPLIFFGRPIDGSVLEEYEKSLYIGADYTDAGQIQGRMIGKYLLDNYDLTDLNNDGKISYVMLKGEEDNKEANSRTFCSVEEADTLLAKEGKPAIEYYDADSDKKYYTDTDDSWSFESAYKHMSSVLKEYNNLNSNMIELVIANNDDMALGAIEALREAGYNHSTGNKIIPVFGIGGTMDAQNAIYGGIMVGSVRQNPEYMAKIIEEVCTNMLDGKDKFKNIDQEIIIGQNRINIPYEEYFGHKNI